MLKLLATAAAAALVSTAAAAQNAEPCAPRDQIVRELADNYREQRLALGLGADGHVLELFVGPTRDWTLLATRPDGISCIVVFGSFLEMMPLSSGPADPA